MASDPCTACGDTNWGVMRVVGANGGRGVYVDCMTCLSRSRDVNKRVTDTGKPSQMAQGDGDVNG